MPTRVVRIAVPELLAACKAQGTEPPVGLSNQLVQGLLFAGGEGAHSGLGSVETDGTAEGLAAMFH